MGCYLLPGGLPDHANPFLKSLQGLLISFASPLAVCLMHQSQPPAGSGLSHFPHLLLRSQPSLSPFGSVPLGSTFLVNSLHQSSELSPKHCHFLRFSSQQTVVFSSVLNNSWKPIFCKSHFELSRELLMVSSSSTLTIKNLLWLLPLISTPVINSPLLPNSKMTLALDLCVYPIPALVTVPNLEAYTGVKKAGSEVSCLTWNLISASGSCAPLGPLFNLSVPQFPP